MLGIDDDSREEVDVPALTAVGVVVFEIPNIDPWNLGQHIRDERTAGQFTICINKKLGEVLVQQHGIKLALAKSAVGEISVRRLSRSKAAL